MDHQHLTAAGADNRDRTTAALGVVLRIKWADTLYETVFRSLEVATTRTGMVSLTGVFDDVEIDGTTVNHAYLHNLDIRAVRRFPASAQPAPRSPSGFCCRSGRTCVPAVRDTLNQFIAALGIPEVGRHAGRILNRHFGGSWDAFEQAIRDGYDFGEDGDAQILSPGQLAAGLLARDDVIGFLADGAEMMQTGEGIEHLEEHLLNLDSEFRFKCRRCGKCCIHQETIIFNARDIYNIAKKKGMTVQEVVNAYTAETAHRP